MSILKCKMCGGDLDISGDVSVVKCEYCGTTQTVPNVDDEKKVALFTRANRLRFACEFDKAAGVYETIVADFPEEAEAYWGLLLCKYGIEYVDDPATAKKVPTCHRSSFESIMDDDNFDLVMENADSVARSIYREEAKQIEELRKGIIEVSSKEDPYDIFICYKETDENGQRTVDSVIAQDVYTELVNKGYRVFFSRITLEDKLGQQYEPYIFAALNSAKIMLVFGTDYEYFNAVWVKNEWSRFLQLIAKGEKKVVIPCYKDIDAYDMPKEFAKLQAQDMGKVGAIQDLLRGIEKIIPKETAKANNTATQSGANNPTVDSLLKRVFMFLEEGKWDSADEYCEKILDIDPECAESYLGKMMVDLKVKKREDLAKLSKSFEDNDYYKKVIKFASSDLKAELMGYIDSIFGPAYTDAVTIMEGGKDNTDQYLKAAAQFRSLGDYKDSKELCAKCEKAAENFGIYNTAKNTIEYSVNEDEVDETIERLSAVSDILNCEEFVKNAKQDWLKKMQRIDSIVTDLKKNCTSRACTDDTKTLKGKIIKAQNRKKVLETLADSFPIYEQTLKNIELELAEKKQKISVLETEFNSLGIFSGKRKKEIKNNISILKKDIVTLTDSISKNKEKIKGYTDITQIKNEISEIEKSNTEYEAELKQIEEAIAKANEESVKNEERVKELFSDELCNYVFNNKQVIFILLHLSYAVDMILNDVKLFLKCKIAELQFKFIDNVKNDSKSFKIMKRKIELANDASFPLNDNIVSTGTHIALKKDGTVVTETSVYNSYDFSCWSDITAIDDYTQFVGLKKDGTVVAVGNNSDGQCNVSGWSNITAISAGYYHTVGLKKDGTVVAVGNNSDGQCNVSGWSNITAISAGYKRTVGYKKDGTVVAAGNNGRDQCNVSRQGNYGLTFKESLILESLKSKKTIAFNYADFGGFDGSNEFLKNERRNGMRGTMADVVGFVSNDLFVSNDEEEAIMELRDDGTVAITGGDDSLRKEIEKNENWNNIIDIDCSDEGFYGLRLDGTVVSTSGSKNTWHGFAVSEWLEN